MERIRGRSSVAAVVSSVGILTVVAAVDIILEQVLGLKTTPSVVRGVATGAV
jgi:hypothetical protein